MTEVQRDRDMPGDSASIGVDVGGTFTDLVLIDGQAGVHLDKVPSTPGRPDAVLDGIRRITGTAGVAASGVDLFVHGFTVATTAFLTRNGARVALAVTEGMRDILEIGDQMRPHLYRLSQTKPLPVVPRSRTIEVAERRDAHGKVVTPLTMEETRRVAAAIAALEPESVAICLAFSFLDAAHEEMLEEALVEELPGVPLYLSSRVNPQIEEYPRANSTALAAYVGPIVDRYVATLDQALAADNVAAPLRLMRSDGGIATPRSARDNPAAMLFSGPAGGVIAGANMAEELGVGDLVTFDMGGTSADFSVIAGGEPRMVTERRVGGVPLRLPTLDIETISAGGGSIAHVDIGGALRVGPQSAGAEPGPACAPSCTYDARERTSDQTFSCAQGAIVHCCAHVGVARQIREAAREAVSASGLGARAFEMARGLPKWSLKGVLDKSREVSPSVDTAAAICSAIGLEFYVGPPREEPVETIVLPTLPRGVRHAGEPPPGGRGGVHVTPWPIQVVEGRSLSPVGCAFFGSSFLSRFDLNPNVCVSFRMTGDQSMEPTLHAGSAVLADEKRRRREEGKLYMVILPDDDGPTVRRAGLDKGGRWWLLCDNPPPSSVLWTEDVVLVGQAVWAARMLFD